MLPRLLGLAVLAQASSALATEPTHCSPAERIFFNCSVRGGKVVSVCGSSDVSATSGYIQYRFGVPGHPELVFPPALDDSQQKFELESHRPSQGESELLNFAIGAFQYSVFQAAGTDPAPFKSAGVTVTRITAGVPKYIDFKCGPSRVEGLSGLSGIVRTVE